MLREYIKTNRNYCDIDKCFNSGQSFVWNKINDSWYGFMHGIPAIVTQTDTEIIIDSDVDFDHFKKYLDLETDYSGMFDTDQLNSTELQYVQKGKGIRILREDLFETLMTAVLTPRQTMEQTNRILNRLKQDFGEAYDLNGVTMYNFPTLQSLKNISIEQCNFYGMGYRSKYFKGIIDYLIEYPDTLEKIKKSDHFDAKMRLKQLNGVGDKVAECVCLFALHHLDAFPIDTHIQQLMSTGQFNVSKYHPYEGVMHQYMYYTKAILKESI